MKEKIKPAGGQAVIEGVMMMRGNKVNTSVRKKNKIISKRRRIKNKSKASKLFFIRGIVNLFTMLKIGIESLIWSAEQQTEENEKISKAEVMFSMLMAIFFAILLFVALPLYLTKLIYSQDGILFDVIDGIIRILVFLLYVYLISRMKDIKRVFQYHGAEHKTVHCYESGKKLTVENVKKFSTHHPRCGTSFLIIVLIISIFVFSFITSPRWYYKLGFRIILLPVIVGLSYEILKLADLFKENWFFSMINKPGLWIQRITTKEPTKKQIEVAIDSLKKVL
ncbi:metal-dependent enzyme [Candidatus Woesearchaeota archaeon B3_Woes]|nr:MAG: metal-dependent enzyme [Candidatus Woesearchaeota archaeon B3_Woes]